MYIVAQNTLSILGLIFDILGAWYISRSLIKKRITDMQKENCFVYGVNDNYVISSIKDKLECKFGFSIVLFGFALQLIAQLYNEEIFLCRITALNILIIFTIIIGIIIITLMIGCLYVKRKYNIIVKYYIKNEISHLDIQKVHINDLRNFVRYIKNDFDKENNFTREQIIVELNKIYNL